MKILVCISNVPDTTTKIKLTENNTRIDTAGIQWVINPWDELSLTRALELKEDAGAGITQVSVAHVGLVSAEPTIRKALAIGADEAWRVNADAKDSYYVAAQLAEVVKSGGFEIIFCGIESSDHNGSSVGSMLSEILEYPSVSAISGIRSENGNLVINREIDGGRETLSVPTPFVGIVQKGIAKEPRIAAMRGIMMARTKPIKVLEPVAIESLTELVEYVLPEPGAKCRFVDADNPKELIELLQNEARVI